MPVRLLPSTQIWEKDSQRQNAISSFKVEFIKLNVTNIKESSTNKLRTLFA
jgi:hypothetical protein